MIKWFSRILKFELTLRNSLSWKISFFYFLQNLDDEDNRFTADQYNKMLETMASKISAPPMDSDYKKSETSSDTD